MLKAFGMVVTSGTMETDCSAIGLDLTPLFLLRRELALEWQRLALKNFLLLTTDEKLGAQACPTC